MHYSQAMWLSMTHGEELGTYNIGIATVLTGVPLDRVTKLSYRYCIDGDASHHHRARV
jgi:hypothetical protein